MAYIDRIFSSISWLMLVCLDADGPGKEAADRMKDKYARQGYVVSYKPPPRGKDWNEYLLYRQKCRERSGKIRERKNFSALAGVPALVSGAAASRQKRVNSPSRKKSKCILM